MGYRATCTSWAMDIQQVVLNFAEKAVSRWLRHKKSRIVNWGKQCLTVLL